MRASLYKAETNRGHYTVYLQYLAACRPKEVVKNILFFIQMSKNFMQF